MSILAPFQLLELNVISAQDLATVSRSMRTYAVAWVHPDRKLSTRVDTHGHNNPTWNDKFVFRVDEEFLHADTSAVMIEIYALHWFRDVHVGTVRVLVGNLIPTPPRTFNHNPYPQLGMRFVALQVRRQSGRPQGILNIGVALLHSAMRSMPLYSQLSTSAVGYKQLMGEEEPHHHHHHHNRTSNTSTAPNFSLGKPSLRRTQSDSSSLLGTELRAQSFMDKGKKGKKASSMINGSHISSKPRNRGRASKASSVVSSEIVRRGKPSYIVNGGSDITTTPKTGPLGRSSSLLSGSEICKGKTGKSSSVLSFSDIMVDTPKKKGKPSYIVNGVEVLPDTKKGKNGKQSPIINSVEPEPPQKKAADKVRASPKVAPSPKIVLSPAVKNLQSPRIIPSPRMNMDQAHRATPLHGKSPFHRQLYLQSPYEYGTPRKQIKGQLFLTESELGPSPSEVAAEIANNRVANEDAESSIVAWSVDESVEGLQSKLDRWRTELPPVYDRGESSAFTTTPRHARRNTDGGGGGGLFSCFSNICGCQCSIVCGGPKKGPNRVHRSPSSYI